MNNGRFTVEHISADGKILTLEENTLRNKTAAVAVLFVADTVRLATDPRPILEFSSSDPFLSDTIVRNIGSWHADGFVVGQSIDITGTLQNNGTYQIAEITADGKGLRLVQNNVLVAETSFTADVTLTPRGGNFTVRAAVGLPTSGPTAKADASGASGALLGVNASMADAVTRSSVDSHLGDNGTFFAAGTASIAAVNNSKQAAQVTAAHGAIIAAGANFANAKSLNTTTTAKLGGGVRFIGNSLNIIADGTDDNYAEATSGSGGVISGTAAEANTDTHSVTKAEIGAGTAGAIIDVVNLDIGAAHLTKFNGKVNSINASIFGGSGAYADHDVTSTVEVNFGVNVLIEAQNLTAHATNRTRKDWLSGYNVESGSGGVIDAPAGESISDISHATNIRVGAGAFLNVIGDYEAPGVFQMTAFNDIYGRDKVKLDSGGVIAAARVESKIRANQVDAGIEIGDADLRAVGDITLAIRADVDIETNANGKTYGLAGSAEGDSESIANVNNTVRVKAGAVIRAIGDVNLYAGRDTGGAGTDVDVVARTDLWNRTALPINTDPEADAHVTLNSSIIVEGTAQVLSVSDVNLWAERGTLDALGEGFGKDLYREILAALGVIASIFGGDLSLDIRGGDDSVTANAGVTVDGTVKVGIQNQQVLTIQEQLGAPGTSPLGTRGILYTASAGIGAPWLTIEDLAQTITRQISELNTLTINHSGNPIAVAGYAAQIDQLTTQLVDLGLVDMSIPYNVQRVNDGDPLTQPIVTTSKKVTYINVPNILARLGNIDVKGDFLTTAGSGILESPGDAKIQIINNSPYYLRVHNLTIPEDDGGLVKFNGISVATTSAIHDRNLGGQPANFATLLTAATSAEPIIEIRGNFDPAFQGANFDLDYDDIAVPDIDAVGRVTNLRGQLIVNNVNGSFFSRGELAAKTINITVGRDFVLTDQGFYSTGGDPQGQWYTEYKAHEAAKSGPAVLGIKPGGASVAGNNVFISARVLNINGLVRSGRPVRTLNLGSHLDANITWYKDLYDLFKNTYGITINKYYQLSLNDPTGIVAYYNAETNQIELTNVKVEGGYMQLFGHILSTGDSSNTATNHGKLEVVDGFGSINISNQTNYEVVIRDVDTGGNGIEGTLVIIDTSRTIADGSPLRTTYKRLGSNVTVTNNAGGSWTEGARSASYSPVANQGYVWVTGQRFTDTITKEWISSSVWGIDELSPDPGQQPDNVTVETTVERDYQQYWRGRGVRTLDEGVSFLADAYDADFEFSFTPQELDYYQNVLLWTPAEIALYEQQRSEEYHYLHQKSPA